MPQMAPMNWTILYLLFIISFIIMNIMNFYMSNNLPSNEKKIKVSTSLMNWSW